MSAIDANGPGQRSEQDVWMFLGKVILAVEEFVRLVSMRDYVVAAALGERVDVASFRRPSAHGTGCSTTSERCP